MPNPGLAENSLIFPMDLHPPTVDELVHRWLSGRDHTMADAIIPPAGDPEAAWQAILRVLEHELSGKQIALLAAGPLESLLAWHGEQFIDRVEAEAKRNPAFADVLGGVWRHEMPEHIWKRVEKARNGKTW